MVFFPYGCVCDRHGVENLIEEKQIKEMNSKE